MLEIYGLNLKLHPEVYEPEEDSFLLADYLQTLNLKNKNILEIGTGTGLQALICSKKGAKVTATDINSYSLKLAKENAKINNLNINIIKSNLFEKITDKYDFIIFNTPYLPEEHKFQDIYSKSWDGGKDGRKIIDLFLKESLKYLKPKGNIILVQSTLSDINKTLNFLKSKNMKIINIKTKKFDFEEIVMIHAKS